MNVAIIGAGWAGMAAASDCLARGWSATVFDAAQSPGGRARGVQDATLGELDNGQHLLIGAYSQTLALMQRDIGSKALKDNLLRLPLWLRSADHAFELRAKYNTPTSFNQALMLARARGLSLRDKWQLARLLHRLASGQSLPDPDKPISVDQWLAHEQQSANVCRWLWYPLCLATMNTAPEQACAKLFVNVIADSLLSKEAGATDLLIPKTTLDQLWPQAVAQRVTCRWGHVVRAISPVDGGIQIDGQFFDACVMATPPTSAHRLLTPLIGLQALCASLAAFEYRSIATCYVALEHHRPLPTPLLMFDHQQSNAATVAHWVFDRSQIMNTAPAAQLAFVVSDAGEITRNADLELAQAMVTQLDRALKRSQPSVITHARCFVEKRATFAAVAGLARPGNSTSIPKLVLAGDWTDTNYPAVLEGAVRSGRSAIEALAQSIG